MGSAPLPVLEDLPNPAGRKVLVRADLNVPLVAAPGPDGAHAWAVGDDFRIRAALPTLWWLTEHAARVTICSHLGRPKGAPDPRWSMEPVRRRLAEIGPTVEVLENLRFDPGEEANSPGFVERLIDGHDLYVNDAFGAAHRRHASIVGPPSRMPSAAGRLLAREVEVLTRILERPERPFVAIVGGAKVSDKIGVLTALCERADAVCVGGAMAFTFMAAVGRGVGDSPVDPEHAVDCRKLLEAYPSLRLPTDLVCLAPDGTVAGDGGESQGEVRTITGDLPPGWRGLDIGPESAEDFGERVAGAATVFWNGPMGVFEDPRFAAGTRRLAEAVAGCQGFTAVGGGDSERALSELGLTGAADYVSTGGGAALELIEHGDLPGLAALRQAVRTRRL